MSATEAPVAAPVAAPVEATPAAAPTTQAPAPDASTGPAATTAAPAGGAVNSSLYVGELDSNVTEAQLYEVFNMIGPVVSIRVCRDAVTRRSLGYAYVNYLNNADGERALEQLNYSTIGTKPCRIMWSQRDPALRKTGAGNIFIKNLDETIDNKALHDTFATFGNILSCKVALDSQGNSLGYGFVHYETGEAASKAIAGVNNMLLNDKIVFVGHHIPRKERQAKVEELRAQFTNLYVKNVNVETTEEEFKELFAKFGPISSAVLSLDTEGKPKGFGFVNYEKHDDAAKALAELHDNDYKGQTLYVTRAQRKGEREEELKRSYEQRKYENNMKYQGVNLYVKNLDDDITEDKLRTEFEPFGTITSCRIMSDDKGASKGFGFVCFSAPDEASKALSELNGKMIGTKPLYVSLAQRKEIRKQQLEAQVAQRNQIRTQQQMQAAGMPGMPPFMAGAPMYYGQPGYPQPRGPIYQQGRPPRGGAGGFYPGPPMPGMMPGYGQFPGAPMNGAPPVPAGRVPGGRPPQAQNRGPRRDAPNGGMTATLIANAAPADQKQMIGEALYPKIASTQPELAGKVTGMLLEMETAELLFLLDNDEALGSKVSEALEVLQNYTSAEVPAEEK